MTPGAPQPDCLLCPRLAAYRQANRAAQPAWHNAPVPGWGDSRAAVAVVGLAPGLRGANRTGRPFTGDYAGVLLYETLTKLGFARGVYQARPDDGFELVDCMVSNAVRCAPPQNKPLPAEEAACRPFLAQRIAALPNLRAIVALGDVSRRNVLRALGHRANAAAAGHGQQTDLGRYTLFSSYHCSRLNTNTGRLTAEMFEAVFRQVRQHLD
jgi:uracil-DNA glycosylase